MRDATISLDRIDELLRFLPGLSAASGLEIEWGGGDRVADNVVTTFHPVYPEEVLAFFRAAGQRWWTDFDYATKPARTRLDDPGFIAKCTLDELRTMLTACVRGERFSDGFWAHCLHTGVIRRLLLRLTELRTGFEDGPDI